MTTAFPASPLSIPSASRLPRHQHRPQHTRSLWLITFVDLVMLLLAFFVLVFSMSSFDQPRLAAVVRSYTEVFHGVGGRETAVGPLRVPAATLKPGDGLPYLETVLRTAFAQEEGLTAIQFRLTSQYLILELPIGMTTADGTGSFDAVTQKRFFALGGVLSNLTNRIAIVAPVLPGVGVAPWVVAAARATDARTALRAAGYERDVASFAHGVPAVMESYGDMPSIQILIFPEANSAGGAR